MKTLSLFATLLLALSIAAPVVARPQNVTDPDKPRSLPAQGPVSIDWTDPAQFSDLRGSGNRWEAERGDWVVQIAEYLRKSATKRIPAGETLQVTLTDIKRAGQYEPWRGPNLQDTRIIRDLYPPRISLAFKRMDAQGNLIEAGERKLVDSGFMTGGSLLRSSDPLRYEKDLLDDWLRDEFKPADGLSTR